MAHIIDDDCGFHNVFSPTISLYTNINKPLIEDVFFIQILKQPLLLPCSVFNFNISKDFRRIIIV